MRFLAKLSFKNITRNHRRTLINVISSMIALSIIIFFEGFMSGMFDLMRKNAVETAISDVVIHPNKYRDDASLYLNIKDSDKMRARIQIQILSRNFRQFQIVSPKLKIKIAIS